MVYSASFTCVWFTIHVVLIETVYFDYKKLDGERSGYFWMEHSTLTSSSFKLRDRTPALRPPPLPAAPPLNPPQAHLAYCLTPPLSLSLSAVTAGPFHGAISKAVRELPALEVLQL